VQIDGEAYWDGGYTGNPALIPLLVKLPGCDLVMVRIDPVIRDEIPRTVRDIHDRVLEISFNAASWMEMAAVGMLLTFVEHGLLERERFGRFGFHAVLSSDLEKIPASSKLNNYPAFLEHLFQAGRRTAEAWFTQHGAALGKQSTVNLQKLLQANVLSDFVQRQEAEAVSKGSRAAA
jgi:NTE family protein